jgi:hypothetical protein
MKMKEKCIITYSGIKFFPNSPDLDSIKTIDIAHALSMLCRANGHYKYFYSVAQHSINCMRESRYRGLSDRVQLACLIHDASEAYISDITRPVKALLDDYKKIEFNLQNKIYEFYGIGNLTDEERVLVNQIDDLVLKFELKELLNYNIDQNDDCHNLMINKSDIRNREMLEVEKEFVFLLDELLNRKDGIS